MIPRTILREAVRALRRNKLRSFLTVLGVTIGSGAVICVVAIGSAGSERIQENLKNLGENLVWVEAGNRSRLGVRSGSGGTKTLVMEDARAILKEVPLIKNVSPQVDGRVQVIYGNQNWSTRYVGITPEYLDIRRWGVALGSPFNQEDVERSANVCLIGWTIKEVLFGQEDPIGKVMRVRDLPCRVVGVLAAKGPSAMGQDQDDTLFLPYTTAQKRIAGITWLNDIVCSAISSEATAAAEQQIVSLMRERHRIRNPEDDDFNVRHPEDMIQAQLEANRTFTLLLVCIASVSLVIGGIGIMNVMLVSVTERTREIGVRMAVGATEHNIQVQFLGEAIILSLVGAALGILVGVAGSNFLGQMLQWPMRISLEAVTIASLLSMAVGIFFGYYPAKKAAALDPIEALRFE